MASRIELPESFALNKEAEQITDDVIRICLSGLEIINLFSGKELEFKVIGHPKIIISKSPEN